MANRKIQNPSKDEDVEKITKDTFNSAIRKSNRPRNIRDLGVSTLKNLPATIGMVQTFMKTVNWRAAQEEVLNGLNNTVVIVGQPNSGKSTLFNKIKGQKLSPVSSEAGTTRTLIRADFGPFTLLDTPGIEKSGQLSDEVKSGLEQANRTHYRRLGGQQATALTPRPFRQTALRSSRRQNLRRLPK